MRRFKNILFVADGSKGEKAVLRRAVRLASANRAKLTLFDAVATDDHPVVDAQTRSAIGALRRDLVAVRREELESLKKDAIARAPKLRVFVKVETGGLARSVIRAVLVKGYDLVMKAPGGGGSRLKPLFGSSDQRLMRKCPCPVWIVKPSRKKYFRKILAAVDLNPSEPDTETLARQIMSLATSLAKQERSELHVVHVWRLPGEAKLRGRQILTTSADKILRDLRAAHKTELDGLLKHYPYDKKIVHLIKGRAGEVIPAFAEKREVDLVVIGTVARGGIPGLFIGNTAEKVLSAVDCSVLTLKPEGFETPIKV